ncbi:hypothetical protein [Methyloparacoccus murrellii]
MLFLVAAASVVVDDLKAPSLQISIVEQDDGQGERRVEHVP